MSIKNNDSVPSPLKRGWYKSKPKFIAAIVFTVLGFAAAILANIFIPQVSENVTIKDYDFGSFTLNINSAYRLVLAALIFLYIGIGIFSAFKKERRKKFVKRVPFRFAIGIALLLWDLLGTKLQLLPQPFFPGPAGIIEAFLIESEYILENTLYSLRLFLAGFITGSFIGIVTGILIGWFPKAYYWVQPVLKITGVIPAVAWMPFALTLLPTPFSAATFLIAVCTWYPVASLTALGVQSTPKAQFEAARTLGGKTPYLVFHVAVPHALPQIFTGITTANAFSFTTLVMAEMLGQPGGLGYYINASKVWSAYYKVFAAIVVMAVLFSLITKGVGLIQARALKWQRGLVKNV